jgi:hypothetical protein
MGKDAGGRAPTRAPQRAILVADGDPVTGANVGTKSLERIPRGETTTKTRSAPARQQATGTKANAARPQNGGGKTAALAPALPRRCARTAPLHDAPAARTVTLRNMGHALGTNLPATTGVETRRKHLHHAAQPPRARDQRRGARTAPLHDAPEAQATTARNRDHVLGTNLPASLRLETRPERLLHAARQLRTRNQSVTPAPLLRRSRAAPGTRRNANRPLPTRTPPTPKEGVAASTRTTPGRRQRNSKATTRKQPVGSCFCSGNTEEVYYSPTSPTWSKRPRRRRAATAPCPYFGI